MTTIIHGDNGVIFPDSSVQPSALTTGSQTINGAKTFADNATFSAGARVLVSGTAINTTSGTSHDFTGIPSWVKRITVMFNGISTNGTSVIQLQIGAGSFVTSGYQSTETLNGLDGTLTTGFYACWRGDAGNVVNGHSVITAFGSGNRYINTGISSGAAGAASGAMFMGNIALSGTLDRIRLTTVNGTDTFDAGSVNILYEG